MSDVVLCLIHSFIHSCSPALHLTLLDSIRPQEVPKAFQRPFSSLWQWDIPFNALLSDVFYCKDLIHSSFTFPEPSCSLKF